MDTTGYSRLKAETAPDRQARASRSKDAKAFLVRDLFTLLSIGIGLLIVLRREAILPPRFLGDEKTIQSLAQGTWETVGDSSYGTVATLYRIVGFADYPVLASLLGFAIGCVPYFVILRSCSTDVLRGFATPILVFGILLTSIYMGTYSKEVFIVPIILMALVLRSGLWRLLLLLIAICAYAYFFRNYWFFLAAAFTVLLAVKNFMTPQRVVFVVAPALVVLGSAFITIAMGVPSDYYRSSVNTYRESYGDVNSLIPRYLDVGEPMSGIANNVLSYLVLQFPFPLMAKLSPYYMLLAGVIGVLWIVFYRALLQSGWSPVADDEESVRYSRMALILISFLVTQSFFEPDYGSALKHLTPFVPALLWVYVRSNATRTGNVANRKEFS
ncbi:hypothetical protein [Arthrobacter sp. Z4-13]